jgi:hypothetical protein
MKETFYVRHDYNSRNDEKILKLRRKYPNGSGYGVYWMLIEKLAESSEGRIRLADIEDIAFELHLESEWITDVIKSYDLFNFNDTFFWSNRLLSDLKTRQEKSKQAILANKIRWDKKANPIQTDTERSPDGIQGKEKKGKEKKEKDKKYTNPDGLKVELFNSFWKAYPKKVARQACEKKFYQVIEKLNTSIVPKILEAIEKQKLTDQWQKDGGKFIPHPATWLNQGRWEDETEVDIPKTDEHYAKEYEQVGYSRFKTLHGKDLADKLFQLTMKI